MCVKLVCILILVLVSVYCQGPCTTEHDCKQLPWQTWGKCSGLCGAQTQHRHRDMCCPFDLNNRNRETCRSYCNVTAPWNETRSCHACFHGKLNLTSNSCFCNTKYSGSCCQEPLKCPNTCQHKWSPWAACRGPCGSQSQSRSRQICIEDGSIPSFTRENVIKFCNFSMNFTFSEHKPCILCGNGSVDSFSITCRCFNGFNGQCCQKPLKCPSTCQHKWSPWAACRGPCGSQSQSRSREICIEDGSIPSFTKANVIKVCNFSMNFTFSEHKPCILCENGSLDFSSHTCRCFNGFIGKCCQNLIKCTDNPCKHGSCTDTVTGFVCTCSKGYTGLKCDTIIPGSVCKTNPCQNGATCTLSSNAFGYVCQCSTGFTGQNCTKKIPPSKCSSSPCRNGGSCHATGLAYRCICKNGYTGVDCGQRSMCSTSPCKNGGVCRDTSSGIGYECACPPGFKGQACIQTIKCSDDPCIRGTCTNTPTGYNCTCGSSCHLPMQTEEESKLLLPSWFPYLEWSLIGTAALIGLMSMGCICLKCCQYGGCVKRDGNKDENKKRGRHRQKPMVRPNTMATVDF